MKRNGNGRGQRNAADGRGRPRGDAGRKLSAAGADGANEPDLQALAVAGAYSPPVHLAHRKKEFLRCYAANASIQAAANLSGVSRQAVQGWMKTDPEFSRACDDARETHIATLESEIIRRGLAKSDLLLMFRMKYLRPEYRDNNGATVNINQAVQLNQNWTAQLSADKRDDLERFSKLIESHGPPRLQATADATGGGD